MRALRFFYDITVRQKEEFELTVIGRNEAIRGEREAVRARRRQRQGLETIHHSGGLTMVITPSAPPRHGMPEKAIAFNGPIDLIGSPRQTAAGIVKAVMTPLSAETDSCR